jgi:hypothetical protein
MRKIFIFPFLICCFISCKKKNAEPPNNNEIKATVVLSSGGTVNVNAKGSKAQMGYAPYGGYTYLGVTNEANAAVYINIFSQVTPGTYSFDCEYRPNVADANTPSYGGSGGSITFTVINDHSMEGYFTAISCQCIPPGCVFGVDSVVVSGTFKGDHLN